jgi:general secretion pathway protein M
MRIVILRHMPMLEAGILRVGRWWAGLSRRERLLVGGLGAILAVLALTFLVIKPLQGARASAFADIRQYETLNARIRAAGRLAPSQPALRSGPPAAIVAQSATGFGLTPTTTDSGAGVRAVLADAPYDAVMAWIADVSKTSSLGVTRAAIQRGTAPGHVSATVEFQP